MKSYIHVLFLGLISLLGIWFLYSTSLDVKEHLSPQGCRMSYMYPSYIHQSSFDKSWSTLAQRYSLWLYREAGWESEEPHRGVPVLFIPGNAGSSRQVRSIASSAARQFFSTPYNADSQMAERGIKALDVFAVEFNEDLSAFHGPTLEAQSSYCRDAIRYILSLYPSETKIILMGHSMGGIVAVSLLDRGNIEAIITMSTPHRLPPARFDHRVDRMYDRSLYLLARDPTPVVSLCGGATDMMIPSESCILPPSVNTSGIVPYRSTVFSSGLEGAWTGVGHREIVWCHQVRWRVARAALELAVAPPSEKSTVLDRWLRDGHSLPQSAGNEDGQTALTDRTQYEVLPPDINLVLKQPKGRITYLIPISQPSLLYPHQDFVLFVSQGLIPPVGPQKPTSLKVSVSICSSTASHASFDIPITCNKLEPYSHKLIPNPAHGETFPVPHEGSDESEGVALFEAEIPTSGLAEFQWVSVKIDGAGGEGWVVGGFSRRETIYNEIKSTRLAISDMPVSRPKTEIIRTTAKFPNLVSNSLVVYSVVPKMASSGASCADPLLPPLLIYQSHPGETHYFPMARPTDQRILLHTHGWAPFVPSAIATSGLEFNIYSSGGSGCSFDVVGFDLRIDWPATIGRIGPRYFTTVITWTISTVSIIIFQSWTTYERGDLVPTVQDAFAGYVMKTFPKVLMGSFALALLPLPEFSFIGTKGEPFFAPLAPALVMITTGLTGISWWLLVAIQYPFGRILGLIFGRRRRREDTGSTQLSTVISMAALLLLVFLFIPWQVAFLACWIIQLSTCASLMVQRLDGKSGVYHQAPQTPIAEGEASSAQQTTELTQDKRTEDDRSVQFRRTNNYNHNMHLLLFMTWLLPLAAPVLVVWVRTMAMTGLQTPFDGDHFFPNVAPFLLLVDFASWSNLPLFEKQSIERLFSIRWSFVVLSIVSFLIGSRKPYIVFDVAKICTGLIVVLRIGPRYWGHVSWSASLRRGQSE